MLHSPSVPARRASPPPVHPRGDVAQLEERRVRIAEARGSSPLISTIHPIARREELVSDSVDPVATPEAYQKLVLSFLGPDDPAEVQAATPATVRTLMADAGDLVRERPEPSEWSVLECLGHLVDGELIVSARYRWIVAEDEPDIVGYEQALWVDALRHGDDDPAALLSLFDALRAANLDLWSRLPVEDRQRIGRHRERGPESYDMTFRLSAGHDRLHLAQARRALEAVRQRA